MGGLLWVNDLSTLNGQPSTSFVSFDGNGNVVALFNAANSSDTARYEYGPFGEVVRTTGPMGQANPFRFSTKYQDDETDLLYYGYRYYSASTGRWLSRDPIEEKGGLNLYGFVENSAIGSFDPVGLEKLKLAYITSEFGIKDWLWAGGPGRVDGLDEIVASVEAEIGKTFDPEGKCGNCILELTITAHSGMQGYVNFSSTESTSGNSDYYSPGSGWSNPDASAAFARLAKYFCKGGKLYLQQCDAGGGEDGTKTLQDLSKTIGVPVTAPQVPTRVGPMMPKCTKTAYPDGTIETAGGCNSTFCIKKPRK